MCTACTSNPEASPSCVNLALCSSASSFYIHIGFWKERSPFTLGPWQPVDGDRGQDDVCTMSPCLAVPQPASAPGSEDSLRVLHCWPTSPGRSGLLSLSDYSVYKQQENPNPAGGSLSGEKFATFCLLTSTHLTTSYLCFVTHDYLLPVYGSFLKKKERKEKKGGTITVPFCFVQRLTYSAQCS